MFFLGQVLLKIIDIYSFMLVIYALLSWFPGGYDNALGRFLIQVCEPFLDFFRRLNLNFLGLDFSIIIGLFALQLLSKIIVFLFFGM